MFQSNNVWSYRWFLEVRWEAASVAGMGSVRRELTILMEGHRAQLEIKLQSAGEILCCLLMIETTGHEILHYWWRIYRERKRMNPPLLKSFYVFRTSKKINTRALLIPHYIPFNCNHCKHNQKWCMRHWADFWGNKSLSSLLSWRPCSIIHEYQTHQQFSS